MSQEPLIQGAEGSGDMALVLWAMWERMVTSNRQSQFASREALCRCRADEMDQLYAVGGDDLGNELSSMECIDPSTGQWSAMPTMGKVRHALFARRNVKAISTDVISDQLHLTRHVQANL